jgi:chorismate mutase/prephenate dehydratase
VNLTWIESFPYSSGVGEYVFFLECEGHQDDAKVKKTLAAVESRSEKLFVLGSFPVAPLTE